jgi:hypothetical protein
MDTTDIFHDSFVSELRKIARNTFLSGDMRLKTIRPTPTPSFKPGRIKVAQQFSGQIPMLNQEGSNKVRGVGARIKSGIGGAFRSTIVEGNKPTTRLPVY